MALLSNVNSGNKNDLVTESLEFKEQQAEWKNILFSGLSLENDCHCFSFPLKDKCYKISMGEVVSPIDFVSDINSLSKTLTYHFGGYYQKQGYLLAESVRFQSPSEFLSSDNLKEISQKELLRTNREVMQDYKECAKTQKLWSVMNDSERINAMVELRKKKDLSVVNLRETITFAYCTNCKEYSMPNSFIMDRKLYTVCDKKNNAVDVAKILKLENGKFKHNYEELCEFLVHPFVKKINITQNEQLQFWVRNGKEINNRGYAAFSSRFNGITLPNGEKPVDCITDKLQFNGKDVTIDMMKSMIVKDLESKRLKPLSLSKIKERVNKGKTKKSVDFER